jgi:hypothetical protein
MVRLLEDSLIAIYFVHVRAPLKDYDPVQQFNDYEERRVHHLS